jgi:hypothetical protein
MTSSGLPGYSGKPEDTFEKKKRQSVRQPPGRSRVFSLFAHPLILLCIQICRAVLSLCAYDDAHSCFHLQYPPCGNIGMTAHSIPVFKSHLFLTGIDDPETRKPGCPGQPGTACRLLTNTFVTKSVFRRPIVGFDESQNRKDMRPINQGGCFCHRICNYDLHLGFCFGCHL